MVKVKSQQCPITACINVNSLFSLTHIRLTIFYIRCIYMFVGGFCVLFHNCRQLTVFIRWDCIVLHWFLPTPCPKLPQGAFTSQTPSNSSWREHCTPATSSCVHTPASPTCPNHVKNNQVCMQGLNKDLRGEGTLKSRGENLKHVMFSQSVLSCYFVFRSRCWPCLHHGG